LICLQFILSVCKMQPLPQECMPCVILEDDTITKIVFTRIALRLRTCKNLNLTYPDRWIGRESLCPWPARSADLTFLDFYLWGTVKDLVFQTRPTTREDIILRMINAIRSISMEEVKRVVLRTRERVMLCIENDGKQFEHLERHEHL
jgi:hypothetical protein